jgi:hypothetical protein
MITLIAVYILVLLAEFTLYALKGYEDEAIKATEFRKALMFVVLHLNAFSILLLYYYVAINQKRKQSSTHQD